MTLQSSGPISLQNIQAEFGGPSSNITLQSYYSGGSYVASGTKNGSGITIPTSGAIKIQDFYGASSIVIGSSSYGIFSQGAPGGTSSGSISFNTNGTMSHSGAGSITAGQWSGQTNWATPTTTNIGNSFDFIVDSITTVVAGGSPSGPAAGTWRNMGTSPPSFSMNNSGNLGPETTWHCRIRNSSTLAVVATFTVDISLENT